MTKSIEEQVEGFYKDLLKTYVFVIMEKQVITDVVDYKDAVIAKTKELVN